MSTFSYLCRKYEAVRYRQDGKTLFSRLVIALTFHYLCKNTTHCFICNMQQL